MKALILSGGRGTRLRPITHTSAKQLLPVANKPILFYGIEAVKETGIKDVAIVVGETKKEIMDAVGNGQKWAINVTYIEQEAPLGLAHAVKISQDFIKDESFVMYLGDNLIKDGITSLVREFEKTRPNAQILLARVPRPEQFGVVELKGEKVIRLVEKPKKPKSDLALVGVYMFDKSIFEAVSNIEPSWRNELEITDAIQYLIDHNFTVRPHIITGWWKDTGKLEDILEANRILLEDVKTYVKGKVDGKSKLLGKVRIEKGAEIRNSVIRGPVVIGENTKIVNSYIGPFTSVYFQVAIENSEIEHSIILEGSKIRDIRRIEDSLVGQNVEILKSKEKPSAYRIMVGDSSRVEVV